MGAYRVLVSAGDMRAAGLLAGYALGSLGYALGSLSVRGRGPRRFAVGALGPGCSDRVTLSCYGSRVTRRPSYGREFVTCYEAVKFRWRLMCRPPRRGVA